MKHREIRLVLISYIPIPLVARSKVWVCGLSLAGIAGSKPRRGHGCLPVVGVEFRQGEVCAKDRSLAQRIPTKCDVSECDREASTLKRPWPTGGLLRHTKILCILFRHTRLIQQCFLFSVNMFYLVMNKVSFILCIL